MNKGTYYKVRDFVRESRMNHMRITAAQVLEFLLKEGILSIHMVGNITDAKAQKAALRATQRYLIRKGFLRGKKTGQVTIKASHIAMRDAYLMTIKKNRAQPANERLREVYLDESYVHHHYHRHEDSVHDPNDESDMMCKIQHKGRRYCFLAAIQGDGRTGPAGLVPNSPWYFEPTKKDGHKGDYHKNFNKVNFTEWWKTKLLPNLTEPSLIIMDNAAYHKTRPADTPDANRMKKAEVVAALIERGVPFEATAPVTVLKELLRAWIVANVEIEVTQLAKALGHQVVFTPPHYSDLQPIELVWALIKGVIGRQYDFKTSFKDVEERLRAQFDYLATYDGATKIGSIIASVDKYIDRFWAEAQLDIEEQQTADASDTEEEDGGDGVDSDSGEDSEEDA
jgi:transposase